MVQTKTCPLVCTTSKLLRVQFLTILTHKGIDYYQGNKSTETNQEGSDLCAKVVTKE